MRRALASIVMLAFSAVPAFAQTQYVDENLLTRSGKQLPWNASTTFSEITPICTTNTPKSLP